MIDIEKYRPKVEAVCKELELRNLDLVGSATRSDFHNNSDLDFLVTFDGDSKLFHRYFDLKERLQAIFGRPVDLIEERALRNPYLRRALEKDRIKIYGT